jgi:hypothetical protein
LSVDVAGELQLQQNKITNAACEILNVHGKYMHIIRVHACTHILF